MAYIPEDYYANKTHNTLSKVVMIDLVDAVNSLSHSTRVHENDPAVKNVERAGITGYSIFGGGIYNFINKDVPFPRNTDDLDLIVMGNRKFNFPLAKKATRELFDDAAKAIGASMRPVVLETDNLTHLNRAAMATGMRDRLYVTLELGTDRLREVLSDPAHYHLRGQDIEVINGLIAQGNPVTIELKVDLKSLPPKTDMPPMDFDGNEITLSKNAFNGVVLENTLEQAFSSACALSSSTRKKPTDILNLYNCAVMNGNPDGRLSAENIAHIQSHIFRFDSAFSIFHRARRAAHFDVEGTWLGMDKHRMAKPTEEKIDEVKEFYDKIEGLNLLDRAPSRDEVSTMCNAAYDNVCELIGAEPKRIERIRMDREKAGRSEQGR